MSEHDYRDVGVWFGDRQLSGRATGWLAVVLDEPGPSPGWATGWFDVPTEDAPRVGITEGDAVTVIDAAGGRRYAAIVAEGRRVGGKAQEVTRFHFRSSGVPMPLATLNEIGLRDVEIVLGGRSWKGQASGFRTSGMTGAMAQASGWFDVSRDDTANCGIDIGVGVTVKDHTNAQQYTATVDAVTTEFVPPGSKPGAWVTRLYFRSDGAPYLLTPPPVVESNPAEKYLEDGFRERLEAFRKELRERGPGRAAKDILLPPGVTAKEIAGAMPGEWSPLQAEPVPTTEQPKDASKKWEEFATGETPSELAERERMAEFLEQLEKARAESVAKWHSLVQPGATHLTGGANVMQPDPAIADLTRRVEALEAAAKGDPAPESVKRKKYDGLDCPVINAGESVVLWDAVLGDYNPNMVAVVEQVSTGFGWSGVTLAQYRVRLGLTRVVTVAPDELRPAGSA